MRAAILGAAAGGGFPQWNSNAPGCRRARAGDPAARARTQASIAVSRDDGKHWFLCNASPDLRQQINDNDFLHPATGLRGTPIAGVVLTGGDVDAIAGLLTLRERQPLTIYGARPVLDVLDNNPVFEVLARDVVKRAALALDEPTALTLPNGAPAGLTATLFAVPGKVPLYLEKHGETPGIIEDGTTVGLAISDGRNTLFFIPGCAAMTPRLADRLRGAAVVLFDGTLWQDDEMLRAGLGQKTGLRMGHMSVDKTIESFSDLGVHRKILIHINNSNPVLLEDSPEHAQASAAGWEVGYDGMRIDL
jgi:pyrroloquinoline quinone biosynthesis protein B